MVEYIDILGEKYPVRIGYYVMKKVKEETGLPLTKALKEAEENQEIHEIILFAALQMGAFAEKTDLDLKREDSAMILDACFMEYLKLFSSDKFFPKEEMVEMEKKMEKKKAEGNGKTVKKKSTPKRTRT